MDDDKFVHMCLKEMFKRVGEKYPNEVATADDNHTKRIRND